MGLEGQLASYHCLAYMDGLFLVEIYEPKLNMAINFGSLTESRGEVSIPITDPLQVSRACHIIPAEESAPTSVCKQGGSPLLQAHGNSAIL
jgi:hypothetical protein